ncbi:hypothetical protein BH23THE1_BH23THE1_32540 [soil metagenome]
MDLSEQLWKELSSSLLSSSTKLDDPAAECDEFYIKAGLKGIRSYHDEIVNAGRKLRSGLKPWKGRVKDITFYKDHLR